MSRFNVWGSLIPKHIAPTDRDRDLLRREYIVNTCDYWEWYIAVRVARIDEIIAAFQRRWGK